MASGIPVANAIVAAVYSFETITPANPRFLSRISPPRRIQSASLSSGHCNATRPIVQLNLHAPVDMHFNFLSGRKKSDRRENFFLSALLPILPLLLREREKKRVLSLQYITFYYFRVQRILDIIRKDANKLTWNMRCVQSEIVLLMDMTAVFSSGDRSVNFNSLRSVLH